MELHQRLLLYQQEYLALVEEEEEEREDPQMEDLANKVPEVLLEQQAAVQVEGVEEENMNPKQVLRAAAVAEGTEQQVAVGVHTQVPAQQLLTVPEDLLKTPIIPMAEGEGVEEENMGIRN
jgi:hypothetical protein